MRSLTHGNPSVLRITFETSVDLRKRASWFYDASRLAHQDKVSKSFDPPEGRQPYSYVFDLTGEVRHDRPDLVRVISPNSVFHFATHQGIMAPLTGFGLHARRRPWVHARAGPDPADGEHRAAARGGGGTPGGEGVRAADAGVLRHAGEGRARREGEREAIGGARSVVARDAACAGEHREVGSHMPRRFALERD